MASASDNVGGVSHNSIAIKQENSTIDECRDEKNVNLPVTDLSSINFKDHFTRKLVEYDEQHQGSHRKSWTSGRIAEVINDIKKARMTMSSGQRRTAMDYYWMNKYDIVIIDNEDCLIFKRLTATAPTVRILPREQYFDVISDIHQSCGYGGRDKILQYIKNKYYIPKKAVEIFVSLCPICKTKRNTAKKGDETKPSETKPNEVKPRDCNIEGQANISGFNLTGQFNLMDFQSSPDGEFKWLLVYQETATKFLNLRPLKTKTAVQVAAELLKIFLTFGPPYILQSDDHEFSAHVLRELVAMWPECNTVQGNQIVEGSNQDVENMLRDWMIEQNSPNWSTGCFFVQYSKNASFHRMVGKSPYNALFGSEPRADINRSGSIFLTVKKEEPL